MSFINDELIREYTNYIPISEKDYQYAKANMPEDLFNSNFVIKNRSYYQHLTPKESELSNVIANKLNKNLNTMNQTLSTLLSVMNQTLSSIDKKVKLFYIISIVNLVIFAIGIIIILL